jgi:hypothetical protein
MYRYFLLTYIDTRLGKDASTKIKQIEKLYENYFQFST